MTEMLNYVRDLLWGWQSLALGLLGLNELCEWLTGRSWKWLHQYRWPVALVLLFVAQALVYRDAALRHENERTTTITPVLAENPDHARLADLLEDANAELQQLRADNTRLTADVDAAESDLAAAHKTISDLRGELDRAASQREDCETLADLLRQGRPLLGRLIKLRAAPEVKVEIDRWYSASCGSMSNAQCEAFKSAAPSPYMIAGYPVNDGGYYQGLRGKLDFLTSRLSTACE